MAIDHPRQGILITALSSIIMPRRKRPRAAAGSIAVVSLLSCWKVSSAFNVVPPFAPTARKQSTRTLSPFCSSLRETLNNNEDWRSFRAQLVKKGLPSLGDVSDTNTTVNSETSSYAYECTPLVEVGTVLISIPTTDLCQSLEQQYWHRSAILITTLSNDRINGDVEIVPEEQLAQGAGRGRWTYRGLLLNRMTDLMFDGANGKQRRQVASDGGNESKTSSEERNIDGGAWRVMRGGDLAGLDSPDGQTEFTCLHTLDLSDPKIRNMSTQVIGNLCMISLEDTRSLCVSEPSRYSPGDFFTYGGFCSWRPGQLEREMGEGREEWLALSVDDRSIVGQIEQQLMKSIESTSTINKKDDEILSPKARRLLESGTTMWRNFLHMIGLSESKATERLPSGQLKYYDYMLEVWAEQTLCVDVDLDEGDSGIHKDEIKAVDSSSLIGPGTIVRGTADVSNDILLFDKELIRSLILVLEDTSEATVGIILNHPLSAAVECLEGESPLPLRYGGPIDAHDWKVGAIEDDDDFGEDEIYEGFLEYKMGSDEAKGQDIENYDLSEDEDDFDDSPFIWIHRDEHLGGRGPNRGGGVSLGSSGWFMIKETDALEALQSKNLAQRDVMVFSGVCIWEKAENLGTLNGGLREQIDGLRSFEVVQPFYERKDEIIDNVWAILNKGQTILTKDTFETNIEAAVEAWEACTDAIDLPIVAKSSFQEALADASLQAWVGVNLLGDPLGTVVEVKGARNDSEGQGQGQEA